MIMPASVPTSEEFDALRSFTNQTSDQVAGHEESIEDLRTSVASLLTRVAALEEGGPGPTGPPAPDGLTLSPNHTTRVVVVSWSPVAGADDYQVFIDGGTPSAAVTTTSVSSPPLAYGNHSFTVRARENGIWGSQSAPVTVTLTDPGTPPVGQLIYATDFSDFRDLLGYEPYDDGYFQQVGGTITQQSDGPSNKVGRFTINGGGSRAEAILAYSEAQTDIHEGDDLWFASRIRLAGNYPVSQQWQLIQQWKQGSGSGSPPIELDAEDGEWRLCGGESDPRGFRGFRIGLGAAVPGVWVNWLFHIKFSSDPAVGRINAWRDGVQVITDSTGSTRNNAGTMYPNSHSYPKVGYYRNTDIGVTSYTEVDYYRIGTTRAAVEI